MEQARGAFVLPVHGQKICYYLYMDRWKITYYITPGGASPVYEFIESLSAASIGKVYRSIEYLAQYGILLREPHVKKVLGTDLWELRILGDQNVRFFYIARVEKNFLMLHGFTKKAQKTARRELEVAARRLMEYTTRTRKVGS